MTRPAQRPIRPPRTARRARLFDALEVTGRARSHGDPLRCGLVPQEDATLEWRNTRTSRLAIAPERGHVTLAGVRRYDLDRGSEDVYKGIFKHTQYLHLGGHTVLAPTFTRARSFSNSRPRK